MSFGDKLFKAIAPQIVVVILLIFVLCSTVVYLVAFKKEKQETTPRLEVKFSVNVVKTPTEKTELPSVSEKTK